MRGTSERAAVSPPGTANLTLGGPIATTGPDFWGIVPQTATANGLADDPAIGKFLNATPFGAFRYADLSDNCNISANVAYANAGGVSGPCALSIAALKAWCSSRTTPCETLLDLPAENNNSAEDAYIANWIVHTEGFQPTYWSIGNEPEMWTHYGIPWTQWSSSDRSTPSPLAYALEVRAVISAVRAVDPAGRFIGIEADCQCIASWFQETVAINGPNLSAIAYHTYPSTSLATSESLAQFYDPLASSANLSTSSTIVRNDIRGWCAACDSLPILVTEYNAGPGWAPSNLAGTYANAVFLAASTVQGLLANLTTLMVFNLQTGSTSTFGYSMMNGADLVGPTGQLYTELLRYLPVGTVRSTRIPGAPWNVWPVATSNSTDAGLLVVNADLTSWTNFSTADALPPGRATLISWQPGEAAPVRATVALPGPVSVPPQGIALLVDPLAAPAPGLAAEPTASPAAGIAPLATQLAVAPTGGAPPYSATWAFGDGGTGRGLVTHHSYAAAGNYTATVTVTDSAGRSANGSVEVHAFAPQPGWFVSAWANVSAGTAPLSAEFSATIHGGTPPYLVTWDLGNGASELGSNASTLYTTPGNYTAAVTVIDGRGNTTQTTVPVDVAPTDPSLSAWSLASRAAGAAPLAVSFAAQANGSAAANYSWSFGTPTGPAYGPSVTHTFELAGTSSAELTIRSSSNTTVSLWIPVRVFAPLSVALASPSPSVDLGRSANLTATPDGGTDPITYYWAVNGVPAPGNGAELNVTPSSGDAVNVSVTAVDGAGERAVSDLHLAVLLPSGPGDARVGPRAGTGFAAVEGAALAMGLLLAAGLVVAVRRRGRAQLRRTSPLGRAPKGLPRAGDRRR